MKVDRIDYRILVSGFFNAGKTTLIQSLDPEAYSIETPITEFTRKTIKLPDHFSKDTTTTGFDRGVICWVRPNTDAKTTGVIMSITEYENESDEIQNEWVTKIIELRGVPGQLNYQTVREVLSIGASGTLFIVDGADPANIGNAIAILAETRLYMGDKPLIIVANKADLPEYLGAETISNLMAETVYDGSAIYNIGFKDAIIELLRQIEQRVTEMVV